MTTKTRRPARQTRRTPAERAAQRAALMDRLDAFRAEIAEMDPEDAVMVVLDQLSEHYSERNAQLIVMQRPTATVVRGFHAWKALGRKVVKGEHGIQILAPAGRQDEEAPTETNPDGTKGRQFFKIAYVFDSAQPEPTPEAAPAPAETA